MNFRPTLRNSGVYTIFFELNVNNTYRYLIDDLRPLFEFNSKVKQEPMKKEIILKGPKIDPEFKNVMESGAFQGIIASMIQNNIIDKYSFVSEKIYKPDNIIKAKKQPYLPIPAQKNELDMYILTKEFLTSFIQIMENFFNPNINIIFKQNSKYKIVSLKIEDTLELVDINTNDPLIDNKVIFENGKVKLSPEIYTYIPLLAKVSIFIKPVNVPNLIQIRSFQDVKEYKGYFCEKNRFDLQNSFRHIMNKELDIQTQQIIGQTYKNIVFRFDGSKKSPFKLIQQMKQDTPSYYFDSSLEQDKDNGELFSIFEKQLTVHFKQKLLRCKQTKQSIQLKQCLENKMNELNIFIRAYLMIWYKWNGIFLNQLLPNLLVYSDKEYEVEIFEPKIQYIVEDGSIHTISSKNVKQSKNELDYILSQNKKIKTLHFLNMSLQSGDFNGFNKEILQKLANILGVALFKSDLKSNIIMKLINRIKELQDTKKLNVEFNIVLKNTDFKLENDMKTTSSSVVGTPTFMSETSTNITPSTTVEPKEQENWIQTFLKDTKKYTIIENKGSGDCFFYTIQKGFEDYNKQNGGKTPTYSVSTIRLMLANNLTQTIYEEYKMIYETIYNEVKELEERLKKEPNNVSIQNKLMEEKDNLEEYQFMENINTLEDMKSKVKKCDFWGDEMAISFVEKIFNIKLILFSKKNYDSNKINNVITCKLSLDSMIENKKKGIYFKPYFYLLLEYTGNHYRNIGIVSKKNTIHIALQFKDISKKIKDLIVNTCMKSLDNSDEYSLIKEFESYKSSKTGIIQATPKPKTGGNRTLKHKKMEKVNHSTLKKDIKKLIKKYKQNLKHKLTLKHNLYSFQQKTLKKK